MITPSGWQAFSLDAPFGAEVLAQKIEGKVPDDGQISRGMVFTNAGGIFLEADPALHVDEVHARLTATGGGQDT